MNSKATPPGAQGGSQTKTSSKEPLTGNKKSYALIILGVIWVWFGAQMGSGTACGNNQMNYFMMFGWIGLITISLAMILEAWMFYWGMELSRITKQHHFSGWMREVTYPLDKICVPLFDVLCLLVFPVYMGSCLAGFAEILEQYCYIPYAVGTGIGILCFILIAVYGMKVLAKVQTILSIGILLIICYTLWVGIPANYDATMSNVTNGVMGTGDLYGSVGWAIGYIVLFVAMQFSNLSSMPAAIKGRLRSKKDTKIVVVVTILCLWVVYFGLSFMLFGRYPGNIDVEIFTLDAVQALNDPIVQITYPILLMCAFSTTGPVFLFSLCDRWSSFSMWNKLSSNSPFHDKKNGIYFRKAVVAVIIMIVVIIISQFGFGFVTRYLFVFSSWCYLPFCLIPVVFIIPLRVRRMRRELRETGHVTTAAELRGDTHHLDEAEENAESLETSATTEKVEEEIKQ